jgi:mRNA interferase MazF
MTEIQQYQIWLVDLNPTKGSEQKGIRPCVVVSPDEMNSNLPTSLIVPLTRTEKKWPTVVKIDSTESISGSVSYALVEQLRNVSHQRFLRKAGKINRDEAMQIKDVIKRLLVD